MKLAIAPRQRPMEWSAEAYALGLLAKTHPGAFYVLFLVHMDESGIGKESDNLLLSAVVGRGHQWNRWETDIWRLQKAARFKRLHAKELRNELLKYHGADHEAVRSEIARLMNELEFGIVAVLRKSDYRPYYQGASFPKKGRKYSQYGLCFRYLMVAIADRLWELHGRKIKNICFVLERGSNYDKEAQNLYFEWRSAIKSSELSRRISSSLVLEDNREKENRFLFAPDALAHNVLRLTRSGEMKLIRPNNKAWKGSRQKIFILDLTAKAMRMSRKIAIQELTQRMEFGRQKPPAGKWQASGGISTAKKAGSTAHSRVSG